MLALLNIALHILIADYLNKMNKKPKKKTGKPRKRGKRLLKKEVIQEKNSKAELSKSGGGMRS